VSTPKNKRAIFQVIPRALADELRKFMLRTEDQLLFPDPRGGVPSNKVLNRWAVSGCVEVAVMMAQPSAKPRWDILGSVDETRLAEHDASRPAGLAARLLYAMIQSGV
jgi:hypothetical protein